MDSTLWKARLRRSSLTRWIINLRSWHEHLRWKLSESKHEWISTIAKRRSLLDTLRSHNLQILVETGTYFGDTAHFVGSRGYRVVTVEVEPRLAALARERFKPAKNITVLQGDSGRIMAEITSGLDQRALFYLDGHYSGGRTGRGELETPVLKEVETILAQAPIGSIVIVDDARCFGSSPDYPLLADFLSGLRRKGVEDAIVMDDSIRFSVPKRRQR